MSNCLMGLVGIGGFGKTHVSVIRNLYEHGLLRCVAFCEPNIAGKEESYHQLQEMGAKHYSSLDEFMGMNPEMDFITIATPIHMHKNMAIEAMEKGFHVLLEKPPAVTIQDMDLIIEVQKRTGRHCAVDFQNISGEAFQCLLNKIEAGELGGIREVIGVGMWKRTRKYYDRSPWAGKLRMNGHYVLDGTLSNPFAHLLQNCLIIAGRGDARKFCPEWVQAELYRGNPIEGEDTACARIKAGDAEIRIYTTVCHQRNETPYILIKGTEGQAVWNYKNGLKMTVGKKELNYEYEEKETPHLVENVYRNLIDTILDKSQPLYAPISSCRNFVLTLNGAHESSRGIHPISHEYLDIVSDHETTAVELRNAKNLFESAVKTGKLFSEIATDWSVKTSPFYTNGYTTFNQI